MAAGVTTATAVGFAQSYAGLYGWALEHKLAGWKAESFPLLVDVFILVGELGLFLLALDGFRLQARKVLSWTDLLIPAAVASAGWGVSLVFNIGHVENASRGDQFTAGIPPITAMIGLFVLFRTIHRYMAASDQKANQTGTELDIMAPVFVPASEVPAQSPVPALAQPVVPAVTTPAPSPIPAVQPPVPALAQLQPLVPAPSTEAVPAPVPTAVPADVPAQDPGTNQVPERANGTPAGTWPVHHAEWNAGVREYLKSIKGGNPLGQRPLAERMGMRNRVLASKVIQYVKTNHEEAERIYGVDHDSASASTT
jgi:hypothetical protein